MPARKKIGTILIVDDHSHNLKLLTNILSKEGFKVRPANSGVHALNTIKKELPDLILLDIMMPEMNGFEVCRKLKSSEKTRNIPIIFISAINDVFDKVEAFSIGAADYVTKPFNEYELLARIRTHIELKLSRDLLLYHQKKIDNDLAMAKTIQMNVLAEDIPEINDCEIKSFSIMARSVGGDLHCVNKLSDGRLCVAIGDISGKSIPAALLQTMVLRDLRKKIKEHNDVSEILTLINREFYDIFLATNMFCTFFIAAIELETGIMEYANGGHIKPLKWNNNLKNVEEILKNNIPLGFMDDFKYDIFTTEINSGDVLLFYTDGLTEVRNSKEEFYPHDRLKAVFSSLILLSAENIIKGLNNDIEAFSADPEFPDDRTMVVMKYLS